MPAAQSKAACRIRPGKNILDLFPLGNGQGSFWRLTLSDQVSVTLPLSSTQGYTVHIRVEDGLAGVLADRQLLYSGPISCRPCLCLSGNCGLRISRLEIVGLGSTY